MIRILLITSKVDITTDFIVKKLCQQKIRFYRLNTEEIGDSVKLSFDIRNNRYALFDIRLNLEVDLLMIRSVYFRRPETPEFSENLSKAESNFFKSELVFTLEGLYKILDKSFWLNKVIDIRNAENKIFQLQLAKELGFLIPESIVTNIPSVALNFFNANNKQCIIKPIKSGLVKAGNDERVIFTTQIELDENNLHRVSACPVYLQNLVQKKGDVRVTVVGNCVFSTFIDSQDKEESAIDWRRSESPLTHSVIELPAKIQNLCLRLTKRLSLNFAAIDFILDKDNNFIFLEINPNGQWAWIERQVNHNISEAITKLLVERAI